jgi:hypothetical protein
LNASLIYVKESLIDEETGVDIVPEIKVNEILPEMGQDEFLRNNIKMFNLYLYNNPKDDKLINIEPRDYFYEQGITLNWSKKIDYNKAIKIESTANDVSSNISFGHEKGEDFYSTSYYDSNNLIYGEKKIEVEGNIKSELEEIYTTQQSYIQRNGHVLTMKLNENFDSTWFNEKTSYRPMVAFINSFASQGDLQMGDYKKSSNSITNDVVDNWVYTTHSKFIGVNSYDLNFQTSGASFSQTGYDSSRGLYNVFWSKYMANLIDDDARKVTMYVDLKIEDIINLDFRNKVLIDGQLYILERLEYDPSNDNSSKIVLLKEILNIEGVIPPPIEDFFILLDDLGNYINIDDSDSKIIK